MKKITQKELDSCKSIADVCRYVGWVPSGGNYKRARELIKNLDTSHLSQEPWNKGKKIKGKKRQSLEEILVKDSLYKNTTKLKQRLIDSGLKKNCCEKCGFTTKIELHHINGDPSDNRLENIQFLCPNCHSQTDNFRGKNSSIASHGRLHSPADSLILTEEEVKLREEQRKIKRRKNPAELKKHRRTNKICPICGKEFLPSDKTSKYCSQECYRIAVAETCKRPEFFQLVEILKTYKNFKKAAEYLNVSDNAIRKWCKFYSIPVHSKEMKAFINKF